MRMPNAVFVTGADKGLGFALARAFVQADYQVFAGQYAESAALNALAEEHREGLCVVPLDVTKLDSVKTAYETVKSKTDVLDILINNAAIYLRDRDIELEQLDLEVVEGTMDTNAYGPLRMTQQFLPLLEGGQGKKIINISSEAGSITDCTRTSWFGYNMSKAALNMQSQILQNYLKPRGFRVLAVHPGWMNTDMGGENAPDAPADIASRILRLATDVEMAGDALFVTADGEKMNF